MRVSYDSNQVAPAHLVVRDCDPELLNEVGNFLSILRLFKEP